jgi:hypothetical protein
MLWNGNNDATSSWSARAQAAIDAGSTALLGFNEPDLCQDGSACMSVAAAVTTWKTHMNPFAGKALLGSPAVTNSGSPSGLTWLQQFLNTCTDCHIDFINIHWYSNKWAGANYFKSHVQAAHAMSGGRPIWITEFGLDYSDGTYTDAELQAFLREVIPWLDAQDYVHRYAYFMDAPGMLINSAGTSMSETGILYNNYTTSSASPSMAATPSTVLRIASSTSTKIASSTSSTSSKTSSSSSTLAKSLAAITSSSVSAPTTRLSSASPSTPVPTAPSTPITILSAFLADKDVTLAARSAFLRNGSLIVDTSALTSTLGVSDPWVATAKTLSILYSYNGLTYVATHLEKTGTYTISPSSVPASSQTPSIAKSSGASINIIGIVWGTQQIKTPSVFTKLYSQQATGWGFQISTNLFGVDGLWGQAKVGIIWYKDAGGVIRSLVGRENSWVKF